MLRIILWINLAFLSACGHYQNLQGNSAHQDNDSSKRYSQSNIVLIASPQKPPINHQKASPVKTYQIKASQIKKPSIKKFKIRPANEQTKSLPKIKSEKKLATLSYWEKLLNIFTPEKVKPWKKATLAKASMKPGGLNPDGEKFNQKIYSSKESSRGGLGVAGGGCGCN